MSIAIMIIAPNVEWGRHVAEIMVKSMESARSGQAANLSTTF